MKIKILMFEVLKLPWWNPQLRQNPWAFCPGSELWKLLALALSMLRKIQPLVDRRTSSTRHPACPLHGSPPQIVLRAKKEVWKPWTLYANMFFPFLHSSKYGTSTWININIYICVIISVISIYLYRSITIYVCIKTYISIYLSITIIPILTQPYDPCHRRIGYDMFTYYFFRGQQSKLWNICLFNSSKLRGGHTCKLPPKVIRCRGKTHHHRKRCGPISSLASAKAHT